MIKRGVLVVTLILAILTITFIEASTARIVNSPYHYTVNTDGTLYEVGDEQKTTSPYWWLNSGAKLIISNGEFTILAVEASINVIVNIAKINVTTSTPLFIMV